MNNIIDRLAYLVAGTAVAGAVLAFAPINGELDPPDGPVADTSPSLAELDQKIEELQSAVADLQAGLVFERGSVSAGGSGQFLTAGGDRDVLLDSTLLSNGGVDVFDRFGNKVFRLSSVVLSNGSGQYIGSTEYTPRGRIVAAPITVVSFTSRTSSELEFGYREIE